MHAAKYGMHLDAIFEAGVRTAAIDLQARKLLAQDLPKFAEKTVATLRPHVPVKADPETGHVPSGDFYDALYRFVQERNSDALTRRFASFVSAKLTEIVQQHIVNLCKTDPRLIAYVRTGRETIASIASRYYVVVEAKEDTRDTYAANSGGYFMEGSGLIKVFVKRADFVRAIWALIEELVLGEAGDDGVGSLLRAVIPTFAHEYAHAQQGLLRGVSAPAQPRRVGRRANPEEWRGDFGYITVGRAARTGKRGGELRSPSKSPEHRLRYLGNVREIDSFASGAAAAMMDEVLRGEDRDPWQKSARRRNETIDDIQENLRYASAYGDDYSYNRYLDLLHDTFEGRYDRLGLQRDEVEKVWRRFKKIVAQKLDDYRVEVAGSTNMDRIPAEPRYHERRSRPARDSLDPAYLRVAEAMPFSETVKALAYRSAMDLVYNESHYRSTEEMAESGDLGDTGRAAWAFIASYYFDAFDSGEKAERVEAIFRKMYRSYALHFLKARADDERAAA